MNVRTLPSSLFSAIKKLPGLFQELLFFSKFVLILFLYSIHKFAMGVCCLKLAHKLLQPFLQPLDKLVMKIITRIDPKSTGGITATDLIDLAFHELHAKKVRTLITIGGMSVGFGLIIFLLSIGYGLERLVISRVASLNEIKQAEVLVGQASNLAITDEVIESIKKFGSISGVFPQINTVSKISFNNSVSDAVAYGVTTRFLEESAVQPTEGKIFEGEEYAISPFQQRKVATDEASNSGEVAGATIQLVDSIITGREIGKIRYSLYPLVWQPVYELPTKSSQLLGYTQRQTGNQEATEVCGEFYSENSHSQRAIDTSEKQLSSWTRDTFPIWQKKPCEETTLDCVDGEYQVLRDNAAQQNLTGYITQESTPIERFEITIQKKNDLSVGSFVEDVEFTLPAKTWARMYREPQSAAVLASLATKASASGELTLQGSVVIGDYYYDSEGFGYITSNKEGKRLGYWIKAEIPTWTKVECGEACAEYYLPTLDSEGVQQTLTAYLKASEVILAQPIKLTFPGKVLGEATESADLTDSETSNLSESGNSETGTTTTSDLLSGNATDEFANDLDWAIIASQAGLIKPKETEILKTPASIKKVAIVNSSFLSILGLAPNEAVGKTFSTKFIFDGKLFGNDDYRAESEQIEYSIIGVLPDQKTPAYFVPFSDLQYFAVSRYSQLRVMVDDKNQLAKVRAEIESMGFRTSSVVDTIERINTLFASIRIALLILGMVALAVAALGMFNTLTVSLLEKTRQVGLMKAMGMKSHEVKRLFLAESVIMGVAGGIVGLLLAFICGKALSIGFSSLSLFKGAGVVDIAHIPPLLGILVLLCAFFIGVFTGWYPSRRATKISALNALRYE